MSLSASSPLDIVAVIGHDDLREATMDALHGMGHAVRGVGRAEVLAGGLESLRADLLVVDLDLPDEGGIGLSRRMRAAQPDICIVALSARTGLQDKLAAYRGGADIYLSKPVSVEEFAAAIDALSRRIRPRAADPCLLTLDPLALQLRGPQAAVNVSSHECALLLAFAAAEDSRLDSGRMLDLSGKATDSLGKRALEVQLVRLRKKLADAGAAEPTIKAIRGSGYQLCVPLAVGARPAVEPPTALVSTHDE
jgi:DNA-binding response OmpR family regulator